jgi:hypothetical protein
LGQIIERSKTDKADKPLEEIRIINIELLDSVEG